MREGAIDLPARPAELADRPVAVWSTPVVLPTYLPEAPDRYPAYLDRRVYQGSSGRVYPLPFHDRISRATVRTARGTRCTWRTRYLRVMVLPELGGRIHVGVRQAHRLRLLLPQRGDQAGARRPGRAVDRRRRRVQLAAAPPPGHLPADGVEIEHEPTTAPCGAPTTTRSPG